MLLKIGRKQRGISLLEVMFSLAVISVILLGATRYYRSTNESQRVQQGVALVNALNSAAASWQGSRSSFEGVDVAKLKDEGLLPKNFDAIDGSPWGTAVQVTANADRAKVDITLAGIPVESCRNLENKFSVSADSVKCDRHDPRGDFIVTF